MSIYERVVEKRALVAVAVAILTVGLGFFAIKVKPDHSIELLFPTHDISRVNYERYRKDFPLDDAHALVVLEAGDLFSSTGLKRVEALERDLSTLAGVTDTDSLITVRDVVSKDDAISMEPLFPDTDAPADELARRRQTATHDSLFSWNVAPPDGHATTIRVTLEQKHARDEEYRTAFLRSAREVVQKHQLVADKAGVKQRVTLSGLPIIRSEFVELIQTDLGRLFPIAFVVLLSLLGFAFRRVPEVVAAAATIGVAIVWTQGVMGIFGIPLQVLTQITSIVVMIVSISDTVHIVSHFREALAQGKTTREAVSDALKDSALPCLLTEVTIAGGFFSLIANDMVMIQQFGLATGAGMLLTWLANVTMLPILLSFVKAKPVTASDTKKSALAAKLEAFVGWIEHQVRTRPRTIIGVWTIIAVVAGVLGMNVGKEYYSYDDLRPDGSVYQDLRYVEKVHGGVVPFAVFIEPKGERRPDAMLEPEALRLLDRITHKLEKDYPELIKNAGSLSKYMRKAHLILAGEEIAAESPLPATRSLAAQELLAIDDPAALRDLVSFDRGTAAINAVTPDEGSTRSTKVIKELRAYFDEEEKRTGYRITLTGIYGIADGIYRGLVGGLTASLAIAVLVSFVIFAAVLRSFSLALIALVPNLLPLLLTLGTMTLLGIDVKPTTVIIFSITLVIADDDTIQYMTRFRRRARELLASGHPEPHMEAATSTLRDTGLPMLLTTFAVSIGFLALRFSQFLGLANLGLLIGVSLLTAVFADMFLSPLLISRLKPKL